MSITISSACLHRLPQYIKVLGRLLDAGQRNVTSAELARELKLDETLVRKDLSGIGFSGKPRVGFDVALLLAHLEEYLGLHNSKEAFLIGAGRLGQALADYPGFEKYGLRITALFDNDPKKIGQLVHACEVLPLVKAPELARRLNVRIAILTVPASVAQEVAEVLAEAGILAFWNFSGHTLKLPAPTIVHNEDLAESLAILSHRLTQLFAVDAVEPAVLANDSNTGTEYHEHK